MKRFVSLILSVCFLFSINTVSYAANISSRKASNPVIQSMNDKYHVDFSGMSIDELNKFIDKMKDEDQTRASGNLLNNTQLAWLAAAQIARDVQWRDFKMNVLVCDDDQQIVDSIIEELKKKSEETHVALRFYGFSQPSQIDLSLPYDIALLDIDMGETNGIELARKLRAENENIVIIFITNFIQYAPEGFEVQAFRYLLKADFSAKLDSYFDSAVQEVLQRKQLVTISINSEIIDVPVNDILYLESHRRIIVMHLLDEKRPAYQFYGNITELSEKIEPLGFLRIQKSYLVNMHYVEIFQYNKVQLRGGLCLAPSEKNYNELKQKYLHWRGKSRWML